MVLLTFGRVLVDCLARFSVRFGVSSDVECWLTRLVNDNCSIRVSGLSSFVSTRSIPGRWDNVSFSILNNQCVP